MPFVPTSEEKSTCDRVVHQNRCFAKKITTLTYHYYLGQYFASNPSNNATQKFFVQHVKKFSKPPGEHFDCIATQLDYGDGYKYAVFNYDCGKIVGTFPWTTGVELADLSKQLTSHSCIWVESHIFFMQEPGPVRMYNALLKQILEDRPGGRN